MLRFLYDEQVFDAELSKDKKTLKITENCDYYHSVDLDKSEVLELIDDFKKLVDQMVET